MAEDGGLSEADRDARRDAVGTLGTALRELVDAAVRTEVPIEELLAAAGDAQSLAARLRARTRAVAEIASVDDPEIGERWYSPVYGPGNPVAPPLVAEQDPAGRVVGRVTLGKQHEGPPGLVHGGVVATLLDHVLARSARAAGHGGLTKTLTVSYRKPVRLGVPLVVTGELTSVDGRRSTAHARLAAADDPDTTLAEAEGLFVTLRPEQAAGVFAPTGRSVGAWSAKSPGDG